MTQNNGNKQLLKRIIIVLVVLLVLSVVALAGRYIWLRLNDDSTVTNQIGKLLASAPAATQTEDTGDEAGSSAESAVNTNVNAPVLQFYQGKPDANQIFQVGNMVPGDSVSRYFCVRAYHSNPVRMIFEAEVTEQTKQLGDVLDVVVSNVETGEIIAQGTFNEINTIQYSHELVPTDGQSTVYYKVDVSIDTSVGNPYQVAKLLADLRWYVEGEDVEDLDPHPQTGDSFNKILWVSVAGCAVLILVLLVVTRKKEEEEDEQESESNEQE